MDKLFATMPNNMRTTILSVALSISIFDQATISTSFYPRTTLPYPIE